MKLDKSQLQQNRQHLQKLVNSQRNQIAARETEIDNLRNFYDEKMDGEKLHNEKELLDVQDRSQAKLAQATSMQEEKLNNLKKNLEETQLKLSKERDNLTEEHQSKIENIHRDFDTKARNVFDRSHQEMQEVNFQVNNQVKKAKSDTELSVQKIQNQSRAEIDKAQYEASMKVSESQSGQARSMRDVENRYRLVMKENEDMHKNKVAEETFKNQMEFKTRQQIYQDKNTALEKHYQDLLVSEKKAFEQKYATAVEQHQGILKELENKLNKQMMDTLNQNSVEKESIAIKAEDPFYTLQTMDNQVREDDKFYYLDIPTAEHEKDNYVVTAHKRKIKIIFSRSSSERVDGDQGSVQASRRSESLTKEFKVDKILDSKKIETAFNDGILTYKIAKA